MHSGATWECARAVGMPRCPAACPVFQHIQYKASSLADVGCTDHALETTSLVIEAMTPDSPRGTG